MADQITPASGTPTVFSTDSSNQPEGAPWGQVGDKVFQTQEDFEAHVRAENPNAVPPAKEGDKKVDDTSKEAAEEATEEKPVKEAEPEKKVEEPAKARTPDEIKASLKEAGGLYADPRYEAAAIEFETTGAISEATRAKAAEDFGVPVEAIDQFVEGQQAIRANAAAASERATSEATAKVTATVNAIYETAGGKDNFEAFKAWAIEGKGLTPTEQTALAEAMDTAPNIAKELVKGYMAKFNEQGNGKGPRDITSRSEADQGATKEAAGDQFASMAEQVAAQNDPRYKNDPAFQQSVIAKIQRSTRY